MEHFFDWFETNKLWIYSCFERLHSMPEAGFQEWNTSRFIAETLEKHGWEVKRGFAQTAVLGVRRGKLPGPSVCLRADMDALSFTIDGVERCVHACGHDANMTQVLAVAAAAGDCEFPERGVFMILFQPCEEGMKGALAVAKSGVLDGVDYLLGTHLRAASELESGACPAILHGAAVSARVRVYGKAAHGARPREGINAVTAGAEIVTRVSRVEGKDETPFSIKATRFSTAPGSVNTIPAETEVFFDLRAQTNIRMDELKQSLQDIANEVCAACGAKAEVEFMGGVPAAEVSPETMEAAAEAIRTVYGSEGLHEPIVTPGGEDFHFYTQQIPGLKATVLGFGAGMCGGLHDPNMTFEHEVLPTAAKTLATTVNILLNKRKGQSRT